MELNVYWHGTDDELRRLIGAVQRNCACCFPGETCAAHAMLQDERVLNHLVYAMRIRERLEFEEWNTDGELARLSLHAWRAGCRRVPYAFLIREAHNS